MVVFKGFFRYFFLMFCFKLVSLVIVIFRGLLFFRFSVCVLFFFSLVNFLLCFLYNLENDLCLKYIKFFFFDVGFGYI